MPRLSFTLTILNHKASFYLIELNLNRFRDCNQHLYVLQVFYINYIIIIIYIIKLYYYNLFYIKNTVLEEYF